MLIAAGGLAVAAAAFGSAGRYISAYRLKGTDIDLPTVAQKAKPLPMGLEQKVAGISPFRTPTADFYRVDTRLSLPIVDADSWSLTIDGDVDKKVELKLADLYDLEVIERDITLTCVSNDVGGPYIGAARWLGVRLTDVLDLAGIDNTKADQILSTDVDGMKISTPLERRHGRPRRDDRLRHERRPAATRARFPGADGGARPLRLRQRHQVVVEDDAHDLRRPAGLLDRARMGHGRTDQGLQPRRHSQAVLGQQGGPHASSAASPGPRASASTRSRCSIDGGPWQAATLGNEANDDYWRQWYLEWDATKGQHFVSCRATNKAGDVQTAARVTPFPDGSTGIQQVSINVG